MPTYVVTYGCRRARVSGPPIPKTIHVSAASKDEASAAARLDLEGVGLTVGELIRCEEFRHYGM